MTDRLALAMFLVFAPLCAMPARAAGPLPPECNGMPKAYVLIGDDSGPLMENYAQNSADQAIADFEEAGYMVVLNDEATAQDVRDALNDPCARGIWILGHGKYDSITGPSGEEKVTDPIEMIDMAGATTIQGPSQGADIPANDCLKEVTLHSCGQNLQSWRDHFTGANFTAWSSTVRGWQVYWWQYFHEYDSFNSPPTTGSTPPTVESSQEQTGQFRFEEAVGRFVCDMDPGANCYHLTPTLATLFGAQAFNLIGTDNANTVAITLVGAVSTCGQVTSWQRQVTGPSFEVRMTEAAVRAVLENADAFAGEVSAGRVQLVRHTAIEPEATLLAGFAGLLFGKDAEVMTCSGASSIPTLSWVGAALLGAMLLVVGIITLLRRVEV